MFNYDNMYAVTNTGYIQAKSDNVIMKYMHNHTGADIRGGGDIYYYGLVLAIQSSTCPAKFLDRPLSYHENN